MTEQQLERHRRWCWQRWNGNGDDVFQQAYLLAIQRYEDIEKVNQSLFGKICKEAARELLKQNKHEIPFSCLVTENKDQFDEMEYDPMDPEWKKNFDAIVEREEVAKKYGQRILNALMKAATEPKPSKVTPHHKNIQMELFTVA
jgi:hypothetical protein